MPTIPSPSPWSTIIHNTPTPPNPGLFTQYHQWDAAQAVQPEDSIEVALPEHESIAAFLGALEGKRKVKETSSQDRANSPIQDWYSYKNLATRRTEAIAYEKSNKLEGTPHQFVTTNGLVGIEIEVENMQNSMPPFQAYWSAKTDGSLRNCGIELVSVPLQVKQIQLAMEHAWKVMYHGNKPDFSNRTSIHIHLNCRDLSQNQIYVLCLLYAVFEKHFYAYAGLRRQNSIFCVPLYRTNILSTLRDVVYGFNPVWHKYTGLNLLPLMDNNGQRGFGTIEFRHLYGTNDLQKIYTWIDQILCLRKAAMKMSVEEVETLVREMNTTSSYLDLYHQVFGKYVLLNDKKDFEECVSNLKREIFSNEYASTVKKTDASLYWKTVQHLGCRG